MEQQYGNQDIGGVSSHVNRVWYKNNRNEQENVNPEQSGINYANEMELAVMTKPEHLEDTYNKLFPHFKALKDD